MTIIICAGGLFGMLLLILTVGYHDIANNMGLREKEEQKPDASHCVLCNAPLRRAATSAEVAFAIEQKIDRELALVSRLLAQRTAESTTKLYLQ